MIKSIFSGSFGKNETFGPFISLYNVNGYVYSILILTFLLSETDGKDRKTGERDMNTRQKDILNLLLSEPDDYLVVQDFADRVKCSEKRSEMI